MAPNIPLPPKPIITRWCTWLDAAAYYANHYDEIILVMESLDEDDASSIAIVNSLLNEQLKSELAFIKANFCFLTNELVKLQNSKLNLNQSLDILKFIETKLQENQGEKSLKVFTKLKNVLNANEGLKAISHYADILKGDSSSILPSTSSLLALFFMYAPVTSCDCERCFSKYKAVYRANRMKFTFENLRMTIVVNCFKN